VKLLKESFEGVNPYEGAKIEVPTGVKLNYT
jgi:hypothetical protein